MQLPYSSPPFFAIALLKTYTLARPLMPAAAAICTRASVAVLSAVVRAASPAVDRRPSLLLSMLPGERTGLLSDICLLLIGIGAVNGKPDELAHKV